MTKIDEALAHAVGQVRPPPVETLLQWIERVVRLPEGSLGSCAKVVAWSPERLAAFARYLLHREIGDSTFVTPEEQAKPSSARDKSRASVTESRCEGLPPAELVGV